MGLSIILGGTSKTRRPENGEVLQQPAAEVISTEDVITSRMECNQHVTLFPEVAEYRASDQDEPLHLTSWQASGAPVSAPPPPPPRQLTHPQQHSVLTQQRQSRRETADAGVCCVCNDKSPTDFAGSRIKLLNPNRGKLPGFGKHMSVATEQRGIFQRFVSAN